MPSLAQPFFQESPTVSTFFALRCPHLMSLLLRVMSPCFEEGGSVPARGDGAVACARRLAKCLDAPSETLYAIRRRGRLQPRRSVSESCQPVPTTLPVG
jgi:hypothetical protein